MSDISNVFKGELFSKNPARMKISYFKWQFAQNSNFNFNHFGAKSDKKRASYSIFSEGYRRYLALGLTSCQFIS